VIINGDMKIAQRGTSFSFPSAGGGFWWGADRFSTIDYTWTAGSNITVSQETSVVPTGFNSAYKIATGATGLTFGSGGVMRIRTFIEGFNMRAHYSKTMTLSFWVRSSIAGTYNLFLENGNWDASTTTRAFQPEYTISATNTWEKKTITIDMASATSAGTWGTTSGIGLGITWCLGANANRTGDAYKNGWTTYSSIHMQTSTGTQWATNANATFYLTGVQLEEGSVATPFEFEDIGTTLAKCQRYYEKSYNLGTNPGTATQLGMVGNDITASANHSNYIIARFPYKVTKRSAPTITTYDASGNVGKAMAFNVGAAGTDNFTVTADFVGENSFRAYLLGISSAGFTIHYTASAEL
jgi:hypothetical protein